jgi:Ca-activated chloride channel family protein
MSASALRSIFLLLLLSGTAVAQVFSMPTGGNDRFTSAVALDGIQSAQMDFNLFQINTQSPDGTPLQSRSNSISRLDLKAPGKAQREYDRGYQFLMRKDLQSAVEHLLKATTIYPDYVAAHNALGTAYLDLQENQQARDQFAKAVELDDHLPNSSLNLGIAQLALKDYAGAEGSFRKASSIAPLDLQLSTALAYGEFMNHDYPAVIATAQDVHSRKHKKAVMVHYYAAGAWEAQDNFAQAQSEIQTLLQEDPKSPSAAQFRQVLEQIKTDEATYKEAKLHPVVPKKVEFTFNNAAQPTSQEASAQARQLLQGLKEKKQIADAEASPEAGCPGCENAVVAEASSLPADSQVQHAKPSSFAGPTFKASADEVAIFFAATDHGRSVTDLSRTDLEVRDNSQPPQAILSFRNEAQLPLRLGLVIDTSDSVRSRISFEQAAAAKFLQEVVTGKDDLAFVIGVNNSVLLVQDFTADQSLATHAVNKLAAGGGTALWDAVTFAADKLARRRETQPVARILVVISDGEDNSSSASLKEAISSAQRGELAIYTVSTRENIDVAAGYTTVADIDVGDHALKTLSELTGGTTFRPGSVRHLHSTLAELQQVIRSRYLISYRPAAFQRNGRYRTIDLSAQKDGKKLKVFARKGYYASVAQPDSTDQ